MIIGGSGSRKTNALINLINKQNDIDKMYLHVRDLSEPKYEYLIKKREDAGIKHVNNPNAFIECSDTMDNVYENINDYNLIRKRIACNHSADIDYKDSMKIYRKCTKEPYHFLTIDTTLTASDPLRLRKKWFDSYKNDSN